MTTWKQHRRKLLSNPEIRKEYEDLQPRLEAIRELIKARAECGLTQADLALRMGTTQNAISRLESAEHNPHLDTLARAARAMGYSLRVEFTRRAGGRKGRASTPRRTRSAP